jgi:hypothetical protein
VIRRQVTVWVMSQLQSHDKARDGGQLPSVNGAPIV